MHGCGPILRRGPRSWPNASCGIKPSPMESIRMTTVEPSRGQVWMADLDPTKGHEQAGKRPVLVVSADVMNLGPAGLVVVLPITSKGKGIPTHVPVDPPEGGLTAS